jgi:hypothetical protein
MPQYVKFQQSVALVNRLVHMESLEGAISCRIRHRKEAATPRLPL